MAVSLTVAEQRCAMLRYALSFALLGLPSAMLTFLLSPVSMAQTGSVLGQLETVRGSGCYSYGDNETPAQAKRAAMAIAQEEAVRSHRVFVQSSLRVKNFQLEEDLIQTASAAVLQNIQVEKQDRKTQEICITITAELSPVSMEELINQRVNAKDIAQTAESSFVPADPSFGVRVWTNKPDGRFLEGDQLIIFVESEQDAYIKVDYFQADGTVVHLVPNMFRAQSFIRGGHRYAFGDASGPEMFVIQPPFGDEAIKVLASARPFDASFNTSELASESRSYLESLHTRLRGIKVVAASSVALNTISKAVEEYKAGLKQKDH